MPALAGSPAEDLQRVLDLPIYGPPNEATIQKVSAQVLKPGAKPLFGPQVAAWIMFRKLKGSFIGPINVGWGKGWLNLILAQEALKMGYKRVLVFMPVPMFKTYFTNEIPNRIRPAYEVWAPMYSFYKKPTHIRLSMAHQQHEGIYFMPYSLLSQEDAEEVLEALQPDNIILDEAQNVAHPKSASARRLMRYLNRTNKECRLSMMSGTMTRKNLMDFHHLARRCLGNYTPMPLHVATAVEWSRLLSAGADMTEIALNMSLIRILDWYRDFDGKEADSTLVGFRKAFSYRFLTAPGVAGTGEKEITIPLEVSNVPCPYQPGERLKGLIKQLKDEWLSPENEELDYAMHVWRHYSELTAGFYYKLTWPSDEEAAKRNIDPEILEDSKLQHEANLAYHCELRRWFNEHHIKGLDTPMLVGNHLHHGNKGNKISADVEHLWHARKMLTKDSNIERDREPIYVDDYKVRALVDWVTSLHDTERGGLIWYRYQAIGPWLTKHLKAAGVDVIHCPAGDEANVAIEHAANKNKWIVASSRAHGVGKNLQYNFDRCYLFQWIRSASDAEQTIGRIHRNGQPSDKVTVYSNNTLKFDHAMVAATLAEAAYIKQTIGGSQKLCSASFNPMPEEYPLDWLVSLGLLDAY